MSYSKKAVWIADTSLSFHAEGADGGRIESPEATTDGSFTVDACDLRSFLQEPIDFLKMDIEGAEVDVLMHCVNDLSNVSNLFVEYHSYANQPQRFNELANVLTDAGFRDQIQTQFAPKKPTMQTRPATRHGFTTERIRLPVAEPEVSLPHHPQSSAESCRLTPQGHTHFGCGKRIGASSSNEAVPCLPSMTY